MFFPCLGRLWKLRHPAKDSFEIHLRAAKPLVKPRVQAKKTRNSKETRKVRFFSSKSETDVVHSPKTCKTRSKGISYFLQNPFDLSNSLGQKPETLGNFGTASKTLCNTLSTFFSHGNSKLAQINISYRRRFIRR